MANYTDPRPSAWAQLTEALTAYYQAWRGVAEATKGQESVMLRMAALIGNLEAKQSRNMRLAQATAKAMY